MQYSFFTAERQRNGEAQGKELVIAGVLSAHLSVDYSRNSDVPYARLRLSRSLLHPPSYSVDARAEEAVAATDATAYVEARALRDPFGDGA